MNDVSCSTSIKKNDIHTYANYSSLRNLTHDNLSSTNQMDKNNDKKNGFRKAFRRVFNSFIPNFIKPGKKLNTSQ